VIGFVTPVPDDPTQLLVLTVRVSELDNFADTTTGGFTQVVDSGGQILFADDPDATLEPYLQRDDVTARAVDRGRNRQSGVYRGGYKSRESGVRYVQAYAPVAETDWIVITHVPVGQAYALEREVTQSLLVLLGIAVIGIAVIGGTVGRSTAAAVRRLAREAQAVASGDYETEIEQTRSDEIGELAAAIEQMRDRLVRRLRETERTRQRAEAARADAETARAELRARATEVQRQKTIISVLNRFLRHNLRNRLNVVLGHVDRIDERVEKSAAGSETERATHEETREIRATVDQLLSAADKARHVETLVDGSQTESIRVTPLVREQVEQFRTEYSDAEITADLDPGLEAVGHETVAFVLEALIENAVEHTAKQSPTVEVTATAVDERPTAAGDNSPLDSTALSANERQTTQTDHPSGSHLGSADSQPVPTTEESPQGDGSGRGDVGGRGDESSPANEGGWIAVRVADDGPGIPQSEVDALRRGHETPTDHGSGLGLWVTNWIVDTLDGELTFAHREPTGTVVTVWLPAADDSE
jgi:signal transduction histidine kinase